MEREVAKVDNRALIAADKGVVWIKRELENRIWKEVKRIKAEIKIEV